MNWLFWHSSAVFIQAHIETIYKLKKSLFRNKYTSLISIQQWWLYFRGYTMRYMDVANRLVASPALPIDTKTAFDAVNVAVVALRAYQRARCLCLVLCSYLPEMLVLRLADWWHPCTAPCPPERQCHHRRVEFNDIYIFRNKVFFF